MRLNRKHPRINPRDGLSPSGMNDLIRSTPSQVVGGKGVNVTAFDDKLHLTNTVSQSYLQDVDRYVLRFVVVEEFDDVLKCVRYLQPSEGGLWVIQEYDPGLGSSGHAVYVAKPYHLQRTPWDGKAVEMGAFTYAYSYTDVNARTVASDDPDVGVMEEVITTPYFPGDIILAVMGATGPEVPAPDPLVGLPVVWQDLNAAGRFWSTLSNTNQQYAVVTTVITTKEPGAGTATSSVYVPDSCGRVLARLVNSVDGCEWTEGTEVVLAPLNQDKRFVVGQQYPVWSLGETLVDTDPDSGSGTAGETEYPLYVADPDCEGFTGTKRRLDHVVAQCVGSQIQVTEHYLTEEWVCGKMVGIS